VLPPTTQNYNAEPSRAEPSRAEPSRAEPSRTVLATRVQVSNPAGRYASAIRCQTFLLQVSPSFHVDRVCCQTLSLTRQSVALAKFLNYIAVRCQTFLLFHSCNCCAATRRALINSPLPGWGRASAWLCFVAAVCPATFARTMEDSSYSLA
jgi:hypothetical protein